jgi:multiple sugar transport system ATP-binding protein
MGAETFLYLTTGATAFIARVRPTADFQAGQRVAIALKLANAHLFDPVSEARVE